MGNQFWWITFKHNYSQTMIFALILCSSLCLLSSAASHDDAAGRQGPGPGSPYGAYAYAYEAAANAANAANAAKNDAFVQEAKDMYASAIYIGEKVNVRQFFSVEMKERILALIAVQMANKVQAAESSGTKDNPTMDASSRNNKPI